MRLARKHRQTMLRHCRAAAPNEACGILAGSSATVTGVHCLDNAMHSPVAYELAPEGYLLAADLDDAGQLLAVFHSHPDGDAYPSATDRRMAFWPFAYVIIALAGKRARVRAFRMSKREALNPDELAEVIEEEVEII